jgi:hypothetical protein
MAMVKISEVSVGSGGQASIEFSAIPQTYDHLMIKIITRAETGGFSTLRMKFNTDTGSNYMYRYIQSDGVNNATGAREAAVASASNEATISQGGSQSANFYAGGDMLILRYSSSDAKKMWFSEGWGEDANAQAYLRLSHGAWTGADGISTITLTTAGSIDFNEFTKASLYGIN